MGFIYEKYNNNYANLIVSFQGEQNTSNYFAGDSAQAALDYFNIYLENGFLRIHTPEELALTETGISSIEEAEQLRQELNSITSNLTDEEALERPILFPFWKKDTVYTIGTRVRYYGRLFKVLQNHTSQADWAPTRAPSLFAEILTSESGEPQEWQQPDSTNPYLTGDKVIYEGVVYESLIDNNIWSPIEYPQGWQRLTPEPEPEETPTIPEWQQPESNNAYMIGDRVIFNGSVYESTIDNNIWSPSDYPTGWTLIE